MIEVQVKISRRSPKVWNDVPRYGRRLIVGAAILSLLVHIVSFLSALRFYPSNDLHLQKQVSNAVKIKVQDPLSSKKDDILAGKKIIETPQSETKPPEEASHVGPQDHQAIQETKLAKKLIPDTKALDPGQLGKQQARDSVQSRPTPKQIISGSGTLAIPNTTLAPRTNYEKLLPTKEQDVFGTPTGGYAEYIDSEIPAGDRIDMNTTSFRFISYFTGMRKQIELVWIYPRDAIERGLQGEVLLELVIEKDGTVSKVRVARSSGYPLLDQNMVQTIKLASPFAPIPKGWKKERILVTGAFHYILSYGAH